MEGIPGHIYVAIGAVAAAIVTATISFIGMIISKENKISEFRQEWISEFREEIAEFISDAKVVSDFLITVEKISQMPNRSVNQELKSSAQKSQKSMNLLIAKIALRTNPNENLEINNKLEETSKYLERSMNNDIIFEKDDIEIILKSLLKASQLELKKNWEIVKDGERNHTITKNLVAIFVLVLVFLIGRLSHTLTSIESTPLRNTSSNILSSTKQYAEQINVESKLDGVQCSLKEKY